MTHSLKETQVSLGSSFGLGDTGRELQREAATSIWNAPSNELSAGNFMPAGHELWLEGCIEPPMPIAVGSDSEHYPQLKGQRQPLLPAGPAQSS